MSLTRTSDPADAVSLAEAKTQLRVQTTKEDALIEGYVAAATQLLDGRYGLLQRAIVSQGWEYRVNCFPWSKGPIEIPLPPLISVESVKYIDTDGAEQTLAASNYVVDTGLHFGQIRPAYNVHWPSTRAEVGAVRVKYTAGYADASAVPQPIKQAILLMVGDWFQNREKMTVSTGSVPGGVKTTVDALIEPYMARRLR